MLDLETLTPATLLSASLADIVEAVVARDPARFRSQLASVAPAGLQARVADIHGLLGISPPAQLQEWEAIQQALASRESADSIWNSEDRSLRLDVLSRMPEDLEALAALLPSYSEGLFAGLFVLSEDASGDRALLSLLSGPDQVLLVFPYAHGRGTLRAAHSLKNFLLTAWLSDNAPESDEAPGWVGDTRYEALQEVAREHDVQLGVPGTREHASIIPHSARLHARSRWMSSVLWGRPSPRLKEYLEHAPGDAEWKVEQKDLSGHALLANYWILAHYFLGNEEACRAAVAAGHQNAAELTRGLARLVDGWLAVPSSARIGESDAPVLERARQAVAASARPDQRSSR
ncbi:hypothetical protein HUA74_06015 [Myxococcus sp. CA051A]|uniref:hypothetical protein n=1 Tax=Myxococcus sp. CA051A TaxID=2741739 RepID=UPI00157AC1F2|nr:hypothetical protein [Myxococcus sp. CA051A]NTX60210.1 hypothetical protein [Myxococcus sp. CA051A]